MNRAWRPDPATITLTVAAWAGITALAWIISGPSVLERPGFAVLASFHAPFYAWVGLMLINGCCMVGSIYIKSTPYRATIALFSFSFWTFIGLTTIISLSHQGIVGSFGLWSIFCGLSSLHAVSQWAYYK